MDRHTTLTNAVSRQTHNTKKRNEQTHNTNKCGEQTPHEMLDKTKTLTTIARQKKAKEKALK